jgi:NADH dehydrogenase FAD-containing subunit
VIGGGMVGVELAEFLAERRREVTLLESSPYLGVEMAFPRRTRAVHELERMGVRTERDVTLLKVSTEAVSFVQSEEEKSVPADHVIFAAGVEPDRTLADALIMDGFEAHAVGDCVEVGYIQGAIHSGAAAAEQI